MVVQIKASADTFVGNDGREGHLRGTGQLEISLTGSGHAGGVQGGTRIGEPESSRK